MSVAVEISFGELIDKITILEIKLERMTDLGQLSNVRTELKLLKAVWVDIAADKEPEVLELALALKGVNERLWDIEDAIRDHERKKVFDGCFIELARSVYLNNDHRAQIKHKINVLLDSSIREEKSYRRY